MKPLIGITLDYQESGEYRARVEGEGRYILWESYADAVEAAGGVAVLLPYDGDHESMLDKLDGLLVSGGRFDVDPALSGIPEPSRARKVCPKRMNFEWAILNEALKRDAPVLGICGGMQLLAVVLGGTMFGDILAEAKGAFDHEQKTPRNRPAHDVIIERKTLLHSLVAMGAEGDDPLVMGVNSTHHQAVAQPAKAVVSARSTDGIIEAIEMRDSTFVLGVEWHPEILRATMPEHEAIFDGFVKACKKGGAVN